MTAFLIILSYLGLILNFGAPARVSTMSDALLLVEHTVVLILAKIIISRHFKEKVLRQRFYNMFLIGYCISLVYMCSEWGDSLYNTFSIGWDAFDPIKYYAMASLSVRTHDFVPGMEWFPVSYVYYWMFKILGVNPLVPMFFNEVVFVYAICSLVKFINDDPKDMWYYGWLFLIPELLSFNATSSKDTLCMLCATIVFVKSCELLQKKFSAKNIIVGVAFYLLFILARTSLAMASICGVALMVVFSRKLSKRTIFLAGAVFAMFIGVFSISGEFGIGAESITSRVSDGLSGDVSGASELAGQSANSFARKIVPHNSVEFIVFGFIRSICYIVIDPRFLKAAFSTILPLKGLTMQWLTDITTLLMFISCFYIYKWFKQKFKSEDGRIRNMFIIAILYWYSVGTFNPLMIHVRYRVVYDILFFAIAIRAYLYYKKRKQNQLQN